jgi:hypothetical protein
VNSKRKRSYLALLALSVAAMFVDRYGVGRGALDPADVAAAGAMPTSLVIGAGRSADFAALIPEVPFPKSLPAPTESLISRHLFLPPGSAPRLPDSNDRRGALGEMGSGKEPGIPGVEEFLRAHRLEAVLKSDSIAIAVISGRWLRAGARLDGCTLTDIQPTKVHFQCNDGGTWLPLETVLPLQRH